MFVGYSEFHEKDVYKFWHLATNMTLISRDVVWFNRTYSDHQNKLHKRNRMKNRKVFFDIPSTAEEDYTELLIDTTATKPPIVPVPYPR
jgi:hypothetical protein